MTIHEVQTKASNLDKKQQCSIKGGTDTVTVSTDYIITGDTDIF